MADDDNIDDQDKPWDLSNIGGNFFNGISDWMKQKSPASPEHASRVAENLKAFDNVLSKDYAEDSPERQLLRTHIDYLSKYPQPKSRTMGQDVGAILANAGAGALFRSAGAGVMEAQQPVQSMVADWRSQRDQGLSAAQQAHAAGGTQVIPQIQSLVLLAAQNRERRRIAESMAAAKGFGPGGGGAPAAPGDTGAAAQQGAMRVTLPDQDRQMSGPGTVVTARGDEALSSAEPRREVEIPTGPAKPATAPGEEVGTYQAGNQKFFTQKWAQFYSDNAKAFLVGGQQPLTVPVKGDDGKTTTTQVKSLDDIERVALENDLKEHQGTMGYQNKKAALTKITDAKIQSNVDLKKTYDAAGTAARANNMTFDVMEEAFLNTQKKGNLGVGAFNDWLGPVNATLQRMGLPALKQGGVALINELANRGAIEGMNEEFSAGGRGAGQKTLMAFLNAVPSSKLTPEGFSAAMQAIRAINQMHVARQEALSKILGGDGSGYMNDNVQKEVGRMILPEIDHAIAMAKISLNTGMLPVQLGMGKGSKGAAEAKAGAETEEKLSTEQRSTLRDKIRAAIEADPKGDPQQIASKIKTEFLAPPAKSPSKLGAGTPDTSSGRPSSTIAARPIKPVESTARQGSRTGMKDKPGPAEPPNPRAGRFQGIYRNQEAKKREEDDLALRRSLLPGGY